MLNEFEIRCFVTELDQRIGKLEQHHVRQIDENRKVSRRVDRLEEQMQAQVSKNKLIVTIIDELKYSEFKPTNYCPTESNDLENKTGLSFEEAFKYFEIGHGITRKNCSAIHYKKYYSTDDPNNKSFSLNDIRSNEWEIME